MNIATYARRNMFRRRGRTILTIIAVVITVLIFSAVRTAVTAWNAGVEAAATDRVATRHKVSITMQLPKHYIDDLRGTPGVTATTWANWFGGKDPQERVQFFAAFAADQSSWFDVMTEMSVPPQQLADWKATNNGAILGDLLAKSLGVSVGSDLTITSDIYPGDWKFKVVGIYTPLRQSVDRNSMVFRWDFLDNDPRAAFSKDQIGWMISRINDSTRSAEISRAIDKKFDEKDDQTVTMSERAFQLSFLGGITAILKALDYISLAILLIMTLILANTIAMSVRERTHEYGVLRAIGFPPGHILGFILGESILVALLGGLIGIGVVVLLINHTIGPAIEENMTALFPYFRAPTSVIVTALGASVVLGAIAGAVPAIRASRLKVTDALRRLD
ncbi:MAG TPA: FtsX-like permease family protein [Kofleriaceae bacterium]|jgi:putative ABC transport system permease protein|nr:FtsX-like permease family protein [Kofleriaceae bacterium]